MENILKKEAVQRVQKKLDEYNKDLKAIVLNSSARTAQEAADSLNTEVGSIVKSLLFRTEDGFVLCLVSGDKRCSLNKLKKINDVKDLSMANAIKVKEITGFTIGGVSPIGSINTLETLIDQNLKRFKNLYAAAGHPNTIFRINFNDLQNLTTGKVMDITE